MPSPLTSEERARLAEDLLFAAKWAIGDPESRSLAERAAVELARTADDARDAQRYRMSFELPSASHPRGIHYIIPGRYGLCSSKDKAEVDAHLDAAIASSKSEAAEGGEDGQVA